MRHKILNISVVLTSLLGYLQWGGGNTMFLFQAEGEVLLKLFTKPAEVFHPLTILPMLGQLMLLITVFQEKPSKILTWSGIIALSSLLALMLVIGFMDMNPSIIVSVLPFFVLVFFVVKGLRSKA
ncbi:MAG: hypothetical protein J0L83_00265 [Chitinophagales bacterium]|nr:hypothetical protein [Chitinophagales bacterium]